jgi:pimeloyl-ACP methyl ester carboxylesterase
VGEPKLRRSLIDVDGVNLFCRDTVAGGEAILCLHGRWGRGETWTDFIGRHRDRYRVIAPDQRGHGLSDKPVARYASEDLARDAHGLITRLECTPVVAVGHSMGGRVAAHLAALYPEDVKALAILDETASGPEKLSTLPPEEVSADDQLTNDWPTPYSTYDEASRDLASRFSRESGVRYFLDSLVETVDGYDFLFSRYAMAALAEYNREWYHILPRIRCPVLLVRATESWCLSREDAERMRALIKDCTYFEVTKSDHMVYVDNPEEFYPGFDAFLSRMCAGVQAIGGM